MKQDRLAAWYQASRPPFFVATLVPLALGGVIAHTIGQWNTLRWVAVLIAAFLVHLCTNLANDYFDYVAGTDKGDALGGSRVVHEGKITLAELRNALIVLYGIAFLIGIWIVWDSRVWWLIAVMGFSFFSSLFYTAPPVRYGYLGLGELFVGINMGPIMVAGTAAAVAGAFIPRALWLSVPIGLMVAMILYYQSLPDVETDRAAGKRTIAVRLGKPAAIWGFRLLVAATLTSIVLLVASGEVHPPALVSLATIMLAVRIDRMIRTTTNWQDLHDRGGAVRLFYLVNGLVLIVSVAFFR
ncbi:MAG: 1,4-dihydroxy-2-naphthoate octaprenyltransferase [Desulfomonile sp.]|nr:1,4-dihydroxy-2-naphthoate octaprenyltransferase [Desulfomonile sp.]